MLYNPPSDGKLHPDSFRDIWLDHKVNESNHAIINLQLLLYVIIVLIIIIYESKEEDAFVKQIHADASQGYDFIAYHNYGKRRYYELVHSKQDTLTKNLLINYSLGF